MAKAIETLRGLLPSIVRTVVPWVVGWVIAQAARYGFDLDASQVGLLFDAVIMGGYYTAVRWAEERWPWVGVLLGWPVAPRYPAGPEVVDLRDQADR